MKSYIEIVIVKNLHYENTVYSSFNVHVQQSVEFRWHCKASFGNAHVCYIFQINLTKQAHVTSSWVPYVLWYAGITLCYKISCNCVNPESVMSKNVCHLIHVSSQLKPKLTKAVIMSVDDCLNQACCRFMPVIMHDLCRHHIVLWTQPLSQVLVTNS